MARKVWELRLLRDEQSASDVGAPILVVSQFTLYGEARKGRRPTWQAAAPGPVSEPAYDAVCAELERLGARVERGVFGADMRVESVNDGPVTLILESPRSSSGLDTVASQPTRPTTGRSPTGQPACIAFHTRNSVTSTTTVRPTSSRRRLRRSCSTVRTRLRSAYIVVPSPPR